MREDGTTTSFPCVAGHNNGGNLENTAGIDVLDAFLG